MRCMVNLTYFVSFVNGLSFVKKPQINFLSNANIEELIL